MLKGQKVNLGCASQRQPVCKTGAHNKNVLLDAPGRLQNKDRVSDQDKRSSVLRHLPDRRGVDSAGSGPSIEGLCVPLNVCNHDAEVDNDEEYYLPKHSVRIKEVLGRIYPVGLPDQPTSVHREEKVKQIEHGNPPGRTHRPT